MAWTLPQKDRICSNYYLLQFLLLHFKTLLKKNQASQENSSKETDKHSQSFRSLQERYVQFVYEVIAQVLSDVLMPRFPGASGRDRCCCGEVAQ